MLKSSDSVDSVLTHWQRRGHRVAVPGAATFVVEEGCGEPVLCLHGVPASAFAYRKLLPHLATNGFRAIAFDWPGLGLAERPDDFDYRWTDLAEWAVDLVEALRLPRFHLLVHDIGGPIGFELARRIPDRIASLTVLNTIVRVSTFKPPWVMRPFRVPLVGEGYLAAMSEWMFVRLARWQGMSSSVPDNELRAYVRLLKREDGGRAFLKIMRGFELTQDFEARILSVLRSNRFPIRLIWGIDDPALPLATLGLQAREALRQKEIVCVEGKHFVQEDAPAEIAECVAALAASTVADDGSQHGESARRRQA